MMMSDSEICQSYKDAKKKSGQIDILAQLNATDPESIRKILKDNNVLEAKRGPKPKAIARELAKAAGVEIHENVLEKMEAKKAEEVAKAAGVPVTEELKESFEKIEKDYETPKEEKIVPHIRVPLPPIAREAIEEKLSDLESKIKYHEDSLEKLNAQYKELVDYLTAEGKL